VAGRAPQRAGDDALMASTVPAAGVTDMAGVRYEFRVSGPMSDRAREAFSDMKVQPVPPESIIYADVADEAHLRDLLALCGALGLELVSFQQLPAGGGSASHEEGDVGKV
jgi:hypothetical protein